MNEQLKALYDCFYEPLPAVRLKQEIEDCHQELIALLEKPVVLLESHEVFVVHLREQGVDKLPALLT